MSTAPEPSAARRRRPPAWGVAIFLVLLAALVISNQFAATSGPQIKWVENDLESALKQATASRQRVFLYLYDPADPMHQRNEREIFAQRWARQPLQHVICCRVALPDKSLARAKFERLYQFRGPPLFLLLNSQGQPVTQPVSGGPDEREFLTYIGRPAEQRRG